MKIRAVICFTFLFFCFSPLTSNSAISDTGDAKKLKYFGYYQSMPVLNSGSINDIKDHVNFVDVCWGNIETDLGVIRDTNSSHPIKAILCLDSLFEFTDASQWPMRLRSDYVSKWNELKLIVDEYADVIFAFSQLDEPDGRSVSISELETVSALVKGSYPNIPIALNFMRCDSNYETLPVQHDWFSCTPNYGRPFAGWDEYEYGLLKQRIAEINNTHGTSKIKILMVGDGYRDYDDNVTFNKVDDAYAWVNAENADGDLVDVVAYWTFLWSDSTTTDHIYGVKNSQRLLQKFRAIGLDILGYVSDIVPPVVTLNPLTRSNYTSPGTLTIGATATDNVGVTRVKFYRKTNGNTQQLGSDDTTAPYITTWSFTSANNGTHYFYAKAYDAAGNEATSSQLSATINIPSVDTSAPSVSVTVNPASGTQYTPNGYAMIRATATDNVKVTKIELYADNVKRKTCNTSLPTSTCAHSGWRASAGNHTIYAKAYDAAGNSTQSSTVTINVAGDTTAPSVSITTPTNNTNYTSARYVTIKATATDNLNVTKVELFADGSKKKTCSPSATTYTCTYYYWWATNGNHTLYAKAYDAANHITQSASVAITVGTTTPQTKQLTVSKIGNGTVTSTNNIGATNINCGSICSLPYSSGTVVTLNAAAASGYIFANWAGACSGTSRTCTVTMNSARNVTARFNSVQDQRVRLYRLWNGSIKNHFYTTNATEATNATSIGYVLENYETIFIHANSGDGRVPLYRYWSSLHTDHFFTTWGAGGAVEDYAYEGIAGWVYNSPGNGRVRLYRYFSGQNTDHFYTTLGGGASTLSDGYEFEDEQIWVYNSQTAN